MTKAAQPASHVAPSEAVAPSAAVAEASLRITSDLIGLRNRDGAGVAEIEAMAMHNAAISFLRPTIGSYGIARMLDLVRAESDRVAARDQESADGQRAARSPKRRATA